MVAPWPLGRTPGWGQADFTDCIVIAILLVHFDLTLTIALLQKMAHLGSNILCRACGTSLTDWISLPSSPTPHLHRTFQAPDATEATSIREVLAHAKPQLAQLDGEITQLREVLDELRQMRKVLRNFTKGHNTFLAPMRCSPSEVLTYIFALCLPTHTKSSFNSHEAPLLIGKVCAGLEKEKLSLHKISGHLLLWPIQVPLNESMAHISMALTGNPAHLCPFIWILKTMMSLQQSPCDL